MKIEAGKYYKRRDGVLVGPVTYGGPAYDYPNHVFRIGIYTYLPNGHYAANGAEDAFDLIEEWIDPEAQRKADGPTLSSHTIDQIAIDSLKWHYEEGDDLEPLQREAFRIVLSYYGVKL